MSLDAGRTRIISAIISRLSGVEWTRSLLLTALLGLSWWSTTQGLIGLITAANGSPGNVAILTIGFAVAILTVLISWTLEKLSRGKTGKLAPLFLSGYVLLTVISVGFGYGFYWTHIESHSAAQRAAEQEATRLKRNFTLAYGRLDESLSAITAVEALSQQRAETEAATGGTCGLETLSGPGPRFRLRNEDAATMTALRNRISTQLGQGTNSSPGSLFALRAKLDQQLDLLTPANFASLDEEQTRQLLKQTEQVMSETAARYEAFRTGPSVHHAIALLDARIEQGKGELLVNGITFTCPDAELEIIMAQASGALAALPSIPEVRLQIPLGPDATVAAFGKFANTMLYPFKRDPKTQLMVGRDYIPLAVAIAIDLFILILSLHGQMPACGSSARHDDAYGEHQGILNRLVDTPEDSDTPPHEELLRHSFWWRGSYYLALPVQFRVEQAAPSAAQRLSLTAMVLADAGMLVPLNPGYRNGQWREALPERTNHDPSRQVTTNYHLYRYKQNGLARMTTLLTRSTTAGPLVVAPIDPVPAVRAPTPRKEPVIKPAAKQRIAGLMSSGNAWVKRRSVDRRKK